MSLTQTREGAIRRQGVAAPKSVGPLGERALPGQTGLPDAPGVVCVDRPLPEAVGPAEAVVTAGLAAPQRGGVVSLHLSHFDGRTARVGRAVTLCGKKQPFMRSHPQTDKSNDN